jgi:tetratricopeptide (TPR) repeat protein
MFGQILGHYRVIEKIGSGGMGEVYRARDLHLERDVAIKILPPGMLADEAARKRFRREALALSRLSHPNIATVFDFATQDGIDFLAMEFVRGNSLNQLLRSGPFPGDEVLRVGAQLAEGLSAAHAQGVIHRDLKPANLALTEDGHLKILDFGIAALVDIETVTRLATEHSHTELLAGTLPYMSPEQLRGEPPNARTDIYSAGVVLYELATGRRPFTHSQQAPLMAAIISGALAPPSSLNPQVTSALDAIILKSLSKDPASRYQSARDLKRTLEELSSGGVPASPPSRVPLVFASAIGVAVLAGGVALGLNLGGLREKTFGKSQPAGHVATAPARKPRPSVAVLGFKNLSRRPEEEWLATALSEMLTTELGAGEQLRTVPGEKVVRTKMNLSLPDVDSYETATLKRLHRNLGADYVVLGSYLAQGENFGGKIRLDLRMQAADTGEILASVSETGSQSDVSMLVAGISAQLRRKLGVASALATDLAGVQASLPANPRATRLYSEGLLKLRLFDDLAARDLFQQSVTADPAFPLAHSALAAAWSALGHDAKAEEEAKKAFDLSSNLSPKERLWVEGLYWEMTKKWDRAVGVYSNLFASSPDDIEFGLRLAAAQTEAGYGKDAQVTVESLKKIGPSVADDPRIDIAEERAANSLSDLKLEQAAAERAAEKAQSQGARLLVAEARTNQGWALRTLGEPQKALPILELARKVYADIGNPIGVARVSLNLGAAQQDVGNGAGAMATWRESLAIARRTGNKKVEASALNNIGIQLFNQGDLKGAKASHETALALRREIGDRNAVTFSLLNLGNALQALGDSQGMKRAMTDALNQAREVGNKRIEGTALFNLASSAAFEGDSAGAIKMYGEALELFEAMSFKPGVVAILKARGNILRNCGDFAGSRKDLEQALAAKNEIGDRGAIADINSDLATLAEEEGHPQEAEKLIRPAIEQFRADKRADAEIDANALLLQVLLEQGRLSDAQQALQSMKGLVGSTQSTYVRMEVDLAAARVQLAAHRYDDAARSLPAMIAEARRLKAVGYEYEARLMLGEIEMKRGQTDLGRARLTALQKEALAKGFLPLARKAEAFATVKQ